MKTYDTTCPKCGATMNLIAQQEKLCCPYCNHTVLIDLEDTPKDIHDKEFAKSYGYHKGKFKAESEYGVQKANKNKAKIIVIIVVSVFLLTGLISVAVSCLPIVFGFSAISSSIASRTEVNPFDYIEVSFTGTDGDGRLVITELVNEEIAVDAIEFEASQEYDLSIGDKVRITASSIDYKLTETAKVYTVENLVEYLKDIKSLSKEEIAAIRQNTEEHLDYRISKLEEDNAVYSYKSVGMLLATDDKNKNILLDIYEFTISTESGDRIIYAPVDLRNVIIQQTEPLTIRYSRAGVPGNQFRLQGAIGEGLYFYGFETLDDVRSYVMSEMDSGMTLKDIEMK